jgi:hypothetical protein
MHLSSTSVSGVENHLDTNGDGRSSSVHQGLVNCNIGRFLLHEEFEFLEPLTAPVTCPTGTTEFGLVQSRVVLISEKNADQLFFEDPTGGETFCLNPDLTFSFTEHGTFAGGTGQFTDARSTVKAPANT